MNDKIIIGYYQKGFSIDYIVNKVYKYKNVNNKPIQINGVNYYPSKTFTKDDCKYLVYKIIYGYLLNFGRGAD